MNTAINFVFKTLILVYSFILISVNLLVLFFTSIRKKKLNNVDLVTFYI